MEPRVEPKSAGRDFNLDADALMALASSSASDYQGADPFPHIAFDGFLPDHVVSGMAAEFPSSTETFWRRAEQTWETKRSCEDERHFPPTVRQVLREFNSSTFVSFLEVLTGIEGIIPDPHFRGGGMHSISRGGRLGVHADFNYYKKLGLHRRLNLLLYLNDGWEEQYGGRLELWDTKMTRCVRAYAPVANRCVIFNTTDDSYHGHPEPLECPPNRTRNSVALYYYTAERPGAELSTPHSTIFMQRPGSTDEVPKKVTGLLARIRRRLDRPS
jgi:hypothetical protein